MMIECGGSMMDYNNIDCTGESANSQDHYTNTNKEMILINKNMEMILIK